MAADLPEKYQHLSDYDWMEFIAFRRKASWEGFEYACEEYPPRFEVDGLAKLTDQTLLRALCSYHSGSAMAWWAAHRDHGTDLHDAHIDESRKRRDDICLWAVRFLSGGITYLETEDSARWMFNEPSWRAAALLHRDRPGGEWQVVESKEAASRG